MTVPQFLSINEVIEIHRDQIDRYGGDHTLRDANVLLSALAMPQSGAGGENFHRDLFEMAGAYLFHIVQNHPFVDGNKRTDLVAALVFLELNGIEIGADQDELAEFVLQIAQGKHDKTAIAEYLRQHTS